MGWMVLLLLALGLYVNHVGPSFAAVAITFWLGVTAND